MNYDLLFSPYFEKQMKKIKLKDNVLFNRIIAKLDELIDNPEHYKPLKNIMKGYRRIHFDPFVILFCIEGNKIIIHSLKHHDEAY